MIPSADRPRLSILIFLSALSALPVNMFVPSLPKIADDLHAEFALVNLAITGFAAASAIAGFVMGALSDRLGRRPVILVGLTVFAAASVGCSVATQIGPFLFFRLAQGAVIAAYRVPLAVIRDSSDERMTASQIGYISSAWAIAPLLGPSIGGLLDACFGWRANFVAFAALGAVGLAVSGCFLAETNTRPSNAIILPTRSYYELILSGRFWAYALCTAFSLGTFYTFLGGAPLVANKLIGGSTIALGLYMGVTPAGFILGSYLAGRYGSRYAPDAVLVFARALTCLGLLAGLVFYFCGLTHPLAFFSPCVFVGLGNGLTFPAASAVILSIRPDIAGTASGLAGALSAGGGAIVAFLSGLIITQANASYAVLGVMLSSSAVALISALAAAALDRR